MRQFLSCTLVLSALLMMSEDAQAQMIIKEPARHPQYRAELEPHGFLMFWRRTFRSKFVRVDGGTGPVDVGGGFRATIEIVDPGFVPRINNSVGITFGGDLASCSTFCGETTQLLFPVGLQWNFYLTPKWSVLGQGGIALRTTDLFTNTFIDFFAELGGRYHFNDKLALSIRAGYPYSLTVGPSFFVGQ